MHASTMTTKGQTTLPKAVRDALGLEPGDRLRYVIDRDGVRLLKAQPVSRLAGLLKRDGPTVTLEAMDEAIATEAARSVPER